jgi:hypothetical protein
MYFVTTQQNISDSDRIDIILFIIKAYHNGFLQTDIICCNSGRIAPQTGCTFITEGSTRMTGVIKNG